MVLRSSFLMSAMVLYGIVDMSSKEIQFYKIKVFRSLYYVSLRKWENELENSKRAY
ncbi:hypothetical protein SAMN05421636_10723 [Pricia antarctica]|uniref:Uncharacterized protein n=1 Tax=Pricia antarctica TaxID=641691 RepID=A0A1G7F9S2_9FLAO|nr:hypothetical protein SAMN05421636_10723 [Pricia antarctica]